MDGRRKAAFAGVLLVSVFGTAAAALASAHSRPTVSFTINENQTATKSERFTYAVRHAPSGSVVDLQRERGTSTHWTTIKKLRSRSGSTSAPAEAIGAYTLRVAVLSSGRVLAQKSQPIHVYGDIQFSALCDAPEANWQNNDGGCNATTAQVGPYLFQSAATFDAPGSASKNAPAVNITVNGPISCRTMTLSYGESNADDQHAGGNMMITQSVIQEATPPNTTTFPGGAIQTTTVKLDGGAFQISDESTYTGEGSLAVLENGTLNCYTPNGVVPPGA
jgi:hypothetical protein